MGFEGGKVVDQFEAELNNLLQEPTKANFFRILELVQDWEEGEIVQLSIRLAEWPNETRFFEMKADNVDFVTKPSFKLVRSLALVGRKFTPEHFLLLANAENMSFVTRLEFGVRIDYEEGEDDYNEAVVDFLKSKYLSNLGAFKYSSEVVVPKVANAILEGCFIERLSELSIGYDQLSFICSVEIAEELLNSDKLQNLRILKIGEFWGENKYSGAWKKKEKLFQMIANAPHFSNLKMLGVYASDAFVSLQHFKGAKFSLNALEVLDFPFSVSMAKVLVGSNEGKFKLPAKNLIFRIGKSYDLLEGRTKAEDLVPLFCDPAGNNFHYLQTLEWSDLFDKKHLEVMAMSGNFAKSIIVDWYNRNLISEGVYFEACKLYGIEPGVEGVADEVSTDVNKLVSD